MRTHVVCVGITADSDVPLVICVVYCSVFALLNVCSDVPWEAVSFSVSTMQLRASLSMIV